MTITYSDKERPVAEFYQLLQSAGFRAGALPEERVARMVNGSAIFVTARHKSILIGAARALSDGAWITYLSHLIVHPLHQRKGVGTALVRHVQKAGGNECSLVLQSAPKAAAFWINRTVVARKIQHCRPRSKREKACGAQYAM